jgi:predicted dehydrogenase
VADRPRVALLGCGAIASAIHLRALARSPRAELVGVADPDPAARERAVRIARAPVVADPGELIGRADVDAVVICAPSPLHAELAIAAAGHGKHLYVEKPLATTLADGERVRDAVLAAGVVAAVGFNRRRHPLFAAARDAVDAGLVGDVLALQTVFSEPAAADAPAWRRDPDAGGGPVADLGSHHFDLARWLLRAELERVEARGEGATAVVRATTTAGAELQSVFAHEAARAERLTVVGDRAVLHADRYAPPVRLYAPRLGAAAVVRRRVPGGSGGIAWRSLRLVRPATDPSYRLTLRAFLERLGGAERELPSVDDGLRSLEAVVAAERGLAAER